MYLNKWIGIDVESNLTNSFDGIVAGQDRDAMDNVVLLERGKT